ADGGRVASITVRGTDLLVRGTPLDNPTSWGSYPMVPYAGRVGGASFDFEGRTVTLPMNLGPNAIHGSGFVTAWDVIDDGLDHCEMQCALTWSLGGTAHQHVQLTPEALVCVLTVVAGHDPMPVVIGWHPWFLKPIDDRLGFAAMYERGPDGLPTGRIVQPKGRPWDDCFVNPTAPLQLRYAAGLTVTVSSDAGHWVVYDEPIHATCVEPQSGPPDAVHLGMAHVLSPGEMFQRTMTVAWTS
ncbi:MAG: hypothetical protein WD023_05560, partial [Ilumatobacteraceae bacterium]